MSDTNNQILHDIAGIEQANLETNNQLLERIRDNTTGVGVLPVNGANQTFLANDGVNTPTWFNPMSNAQASTGTDVVPRTVSPANIKSSVVANSPVQSVNARTGEVTGLAEQAELLMIEDELFQDIQDMGATKVGLAGNETVAGIKTFTSSPIAPTPTTGTQVAIKSYVDGIKNYAGQVKVNYSTLSVTNFVANVDHIFNITTGTPVLSPAPTTTWPANDGNAYDPWFYDPATTRLRENERLGQVHTWRVDGTFSGKANGNNGALIVEIYNPDSGFINTNTITLPSGVTSGTYTMNLLTIADNASLDPGRGYRVRTRVSFNDANLVVAIGSIVRISHARENN